MDKNNIISLPNSRLRQRSQKVGIITVDVIKLCEDMQAATLSWEDSRSHEVGVALAAIQVDQLLRIVVIRNNFDDKTDRTFNVLINPQITKKYGEMLEDYEGCLSVKNIYGKVPRYSKVKVKAMDLEGKEVRMSAEGFLARVMQHEIDHTNGILFIDHIKDDPEAFYTLTDTGQLDKIDYNEAIVAGKLFE